MTAKYLPSKKISVILRETYYVEMCFYGALGGAAGVHYKGA